MHTFIGKYEGNKFCIIHNGDYTGDAILKLIGSKREYRFPIQVLETFIIEKLKSEKISQLEDMSNEEFRDKLKI